jgi:hypothetical protein
MRKLFPNSFMCGKCSFGPVDHVQIERGGGGEGGGAGGGEGEREREKEKERMGEREREREIYLYIQEDHANCAHLRARARTHTHTHTRTHTLVYTYRSTMQTVLICARTTARPEEGASACQMHARNVVGSAAASLTGLRG